MCVMCVNIFTNEWRERARERPMHRDGIGRLRVLRKRRCHRLFLSTLSSGNCESAEISHPLFPRACILCRIFSDDPEIATNRKLAYILSLGPSGRDALHCI